jgi:hypothetical protein
VITAMGAHGLRVGRAARAAARAADGAPGGRLFAAAALLALGAAYGLRDTPGYVHLVIEGRLRGDLYHFVLWTRLVALGGVQDAYRGVWPDTYAVYGPVVLYAYQVVGVAYRAAVDPTFDLSRAESSAWLLRGLKLTAVLWHLGAATAVYVVVRCTGPARRAGAAAGLYAANPAALFGAAHWAQPDGAHLLFGVLAVGWLGAGRPAAGWAALTLAALAKPQAWALVPFAALATWRTRGARGLAAAGAGAAAGAVVVVPFLVTGRLGDLLRLPLVVAGAMPVVTGNAHNLWWIVAALQRTDPLLIPDTTVLVGPLTYQTTAAVLVGAQVLFSCWLYWSGRADLAEATALGTLGWFMFTTQAHENHLLLVLALLSIAWPRRPRLLLVFAVLSAASLLNMALHDSAILEALGLAGAPAGPKLLRAALRTANAVAVGLTLVVWGAAAARRPAEAAEAPEAPTSDAEG